MSLANNSRLTFSRPLCLLGGVDLVLLGLARLVAGEELMALLAAAEAVDFAVRRLRKALLRKGKSGLNAVVVVVVVVALSVATLALELLQQFEGLGELPRAYL